MGKSWLLNCALNYFFRPSSRKKNLDLEDMVLDMLDQRNRHNSNDEFFDAWDKPTEK